MRPRSSGRLLTRKRQFRGGVFALIILLAAILVWNSQRRRNEPADNSSQSCGEHHFAANTRDRPIL
ncbi:hypothetical protein ACQ4M4_08865 [Leptolyngbya sp. AN02str]|uniref:hypothetical protein n=1 Tax=Leptolyngbya sp. AN02str TaxID=3423363 RepID=UPI003D31CB85